jgi:rhamnogalacturonyl hydrolase YesR
MNFTDKHYNRLQKLENKLEKHYDNYVSIDDETYITRKERYELDELRYRQNLKQTHGIRLQGVNKYYLAREIAEFIDWIEQNGTHNAYAEEIDSVHLVNNTHYGPKITIRFKDTSEEDYKNFEDVKSMISFIEGHNYCKNNIK